MGHETKNQSRLVVMAVSALHRKAVSEALSLEASIHLVGVSASIPATAKKVANGEADIVAIAQPALDCEAQQHILSLAHETGTKLFVYEPAPTPEETVDRILSMLRSGPESALPVPAPPPRAGSSISVVAIGSSTGGPDALTELIPVLPADYLPSILIAQHMPKHFTSILAERLDNLSGLSIREASDGDLLEPGLVLIAPGDYHMEVQDDGRSVFLHQGPQENSCRPAVDVLFRSVARVFGHHSLGVVLTGMGRDGLLGARQLRSAGAEIVVQDEESAVVWGMPGLIARDGIANLVGSIQEIAAYLISRSSNPYSSTSKGPRNESGEPHEHSS